MNIIKISVVTFLAFYAFLCFGQSETDYSILADEPAINSGLTEYLDAIPNGKFKNYGFNSLDEKNAIQLGSPMYLVSLPDDQLMTNGSDKKIKFDFKKRWFIPVIIENECRNFLFLTKISGKQKIYGMGGQNLANELNSLSDFDPYDHKKDGLLLIYPKGFSFLIKEIKSEKRFYPLGLTADQFYYEKNEYLTEEELIPQLSNILNN